MKMTKWIIVLLLVIGCATDSQQEGNQQVNTQQENTNQQEEENSNQQTNFDDNVDELNEAPMQEDMEIDNQEQMIAEEDIANFENEEKLDTSEDEMLFGLEDESKNNFLTQESDAQIQGNTDNLGEEGEDLIFGNSPANAPVDKPVNSQNQEDFLGDLNQQEPESQNPLAFDTQIPSQVPNTQIPAQVQEPINTLPQQMTEEPVPPPLTRQPAMEPVKEIVPTLHTLTWIGHEYSSDKKQVQIELLTSGTPEFEVFQEKNQSSQPELVIRFFQTDLRRKLKYDIDSSEFLSPIAYIRPRLISDRGIVDIVITLRDAVKPKFYSENSNIRLSFPIPDYYFGNLNRKNIQAIRGERLADTPLGLILDAESELPKNTGQNSSEDLLPVGDEIDNVMTPEQNIDDQGLPDSFNNSASHNTLQDNFVVLSRIALFAVGQDNGGDEFEQNEIRDQQFDQGENKNFNNENQNFNNENQNFNNEIIQNSENNQFLDETTDNVNRINKIDNTNIENFTLGNSQKSNFLPIPESASDSELLGEQSQEFVEVVEQVESVGPGKAGLEAAMESSSKTGGDEKLIYMEFTDAPLSIVFKSFSEETGNNFIFPKEVGDLTISIHFQGVPWDEALRAILETHSLGMVRVGDSIVRVDAVERLTAYLQSLEKAQQFETRRAPTKILVFRLNNAKAQDIMSRLNTLLVRNKQVDPRIQISADERTNSIVMEAPDFVLAKSRNIIERLDLKTPQVEIASRIVEVQKTNSELFGVSWLNQSLLNFDPGRGLGFGSLNFPNSVVSSFSVDPGIRSAPAVGNAQFKFGSINRFIDLDLLLRMEERRGTTNVLQSNRVLVLDGQEATILAGNSKFFRPAAGSVLNPTDPNAGAGGGGDQAQGLSEVQFNLSLEVKPQVTADGSVIMSLKIKSDTPGAPTGEVLADKNTRELTTQMVRDSGDTGVIGGIYDTSRTETIIGIPYLSKLPIIGALFRSTQVEESQTELLIMVTPTIVSGSKKSSKESQTSEIQDDFSEERNL